MKMKMYKVLPEYFDKWGNSSDENDYIVTLQQIKDFANDWDVSVEDLMEQVIEI